MAAAVAVELLQQQLREVIPFTVAAAVVDG